MTRSTFNDMLSSLDSRQAVRSRQFEQIARWFLLNAPGYRERISEVWLWADWPDRWGPDAGIDLIAREHNGGLWAIQAKLYHPEYAIRKADIDSFLSESGRHDFAYRLLIATTDRLGSRARKTLDSQHSPVGYVLRSQLGGVPVSWPISPADLRPRRPLRKHTFPHVCEAVEDVIDGFKRSDRAQIIMACGTGKTRVGHDVSGLMDSRRTLVVVPSLSLLAQTLREWSSSAGKPFDYLVVCSDQTVVGEDRFVQRTSEIGLPVTTDPAVIAGFLRRRGTRLVIFATYNSAPRIAEAYRLGRVPRIDLVVADEAHRCAGRASRDFAAVLDGAAIPARYRLFMTATPRYFSGRLVREARKADFEILTMDDHTAFGPVVHRLGFSEAISRGLLSDYRVVVVGVDDSVYRDWADRGRLVTTDGTKVTDARTLASQIGLAQAMRQYNLHRIISFHSRVARARDFAQSMTETMEWMPVAVRPEGPFWAQHVSGNMSAGSRARRIERLQDHGETGLLANARCLAEGVDVQCLDGIAFIDPRGSEVDIIQAVGRVIRKAENKKIGTIVIPVFVGGDEDPETALDDSSYKSVWTVIRALRAHDLRLAGELDSLRYALGRGAVSVQTPPRIQFDLPHRVGLSFLSAFEVRLVEQTTATWEFWLGLLASYVDEHGSARVHPGHTTAAGHRLSSWCVTCRTARKHGELSSERIASLDGLGFIWDLLQDAFDHGLAELGDYVRRYGHARVPFRFQTQSGFPLGNWCANRRAGRKRGVLDREQIDALDALGFLWKCPRDAFDRGVAALAEYIDEHGHARMSSGYSTASGYRLGAWCDARRADRRRGRMAAERVAVLDSLGFTWSPFEFDFERGVTAFAAYRKFHGHAWVGQGYVSEDGHRLGAWCATQRAKRKRAKLTTEQIAAPDEVGFVWEYHVRRSSTKHVAELAGYVAVNGHARVPYNHSTPDGCRLGVWCTTIRRDRRAGKLSAQQISTLDELGFVWDILGHETDRALAELASYVEVEGHARVPSGYLTAGNFQLGNWCGTQRAYRKRGKLATARISALDRLGFVWNCWGEDFARGTAELSAYVEAHGDTLVPVGYSTPAGFKLGRWCAKRRQARRELSLDTSAISTLDALGFVWDDPRKARKGCQIASETPAVQTGRQQSER
jgi:superfamily II DNA or RNA helicase